jgi:hypothetical protein
VLRRSRFLVLLSLCSLAPAPCLGLTPTLVLTKAKRGDVTFSHGRHADEYQIGCEKCHHNLATGPQEATTCKGCHLRSDHRGLCHECHLSERDEGYPVQLAGIRKRLQKEEIPTLYRAFHALCRNCHIGENNARATKAPVECGGCHRAG